MTTGAQNFNDPAISDVMKKARTFFETSLGKIADPANWRATIMRLDHNTMCLVVLPRGPGSGPGLESELQKFLDEHVRPLEYDHGPIDIRDAVPNFVNAAFDFYREICTLDCRESMQRMHHLASFDQKGDIARLALATLKAQNIQGF